MAHPSDEVDLPPGGFGALVDELLAGSDGWTDGELAEGLLALDRLRTMVEAAQAEAAARFEARGVCASDGARTPRAWLAARADVSRSTAGALFKRGRALASCPVVAALHARGLLGTAKVDLLLRARRDAEEIFSEHEVDLVRHVRNLTVAQTSLFLARWRAVAVPDDDGPEPPDGDGVNLVPTFQGRWDLQGNLDATLGKSISTALDHEMDLLFRRGLAHPDDGLTRAQHRALALAELVARGSGATSSGIGACGAAVQVVADHARLAGLPADRAADADRRRCELAEPGATPIPTATAQRLICEGRATVVTVDGAGGFRVLDASPAVRTATSRQRSALLERDRGCVYPGCPVPANWCDAHHVIPYEVGGPTTMENLVLVCRFHHHQIHEGGHVLSRQDGHVAVRRPDGSLLAADAPHGTLVPLDPVHPTDPDPPTRPATRFRPLAEQRTRREMEQSRQVRHIRRRARALVADVEAGRRSARPLDSGQDREPDRGSG